MFRNFLKTAWRNIMHQKLFSFINMVGLAAGLVTTMLIMVYVNHERSFDSFHRNGKRIYDVKVLVKMGDHSTEFPNTSLVTGALIQQADPLVEDYIRLYKPDKGVVIENPSSANERIPENDLLFVDPGFFNFFSFRLLMGNSSDILNDPTSLVISRSAARKYFGGLNPLGRTLRIKMDSAFSLFKITGVVENAPSNSTIKYELLASNASLHMMQANAANLQSQHIEPGAFKTYLLLRQPGDTGHVQSSIRQLLKADPQGEGIELGMTNLRDLHLKPGQHDSSGSRYFSLLTLIAGLILLLALSNYMSLSTARSTLRAKEMGIRKVSGASRANIILQFYIESTLFTFFSFLLAYACCYLSLPFFFDRLGIKIDNSYIFSERVLGTLSLVMVMSVFLAGSYPSLVLSSYKPIDTLKGKMSKLRGGALVRRIFTIFQFSISFGLIICGIIIQSQIYYFRHSDSGMNRENVIMVPIPSGFGNQYNSFKAEVQSLSGINGAATARYAMFKGFDMAFSRVPGQKDNMPVAMLSVDPEFISLLGIKWKIAPSGLETLGEGNKVVVNETAAKKLKLPAVNPVGSLIDNNGSRLEVAGVVRDFYFSSMKYEIKPLYITFPGKGAAGWGMGSRCLFVKVKPNTDLPAVISSIHGLFAGYDKEATFTYSFLDEVFSLQYKEEERFAWIFNVFMITTLIIAVIGLFGLSAFAIEQRTKEMGVRKVLGASLSNITILLSGDFFRLILLAIVIASPVSWWAMNNWLRNFPNRVAISWWMFAVAALLVLLIAAITVSYHVIRSALTNPVDSLRRE